MLLGGAVGKSAQLPLQTGFCRRDGRPTPVSALRSTPRRGYRRCLPDRSYPWSVPDDPGNSASGGHYHRAITLVMAGFAALVRTDIKRVLAYYSTMSQDWLHVHGARRTGVGCGIFT